MKKYSLKLRAVAICLLLVTLTCAFSGCAIVKNEDLNAVINYDVLKNGSIDTALIKAYLDYNYKKAVADTDGIVKLIYNANGGNAQSLEKYEQMLDSEVKANIDYTYRDADGVELGAATDHTYAIGSEIYTEVFDRALSEIFVGDTAEITVEFPAEYGADGKGDATLAGKTVTFEVKLNYIEKKPASSNSGNLSLNFKDANGEIQYVGSVTGSMSFGDKYEVNADGSVSYGDKVVSGEGDSVTVTDKFVTIIGGSSSSATTGNGGNYYFTTVDGIIGFNYTVSGMNIGTQNTPIYSDVCTLLRYYGADSDVVPDYGDVVSVDYSLWVDGSEFESGTSSELTIGSGKYIAEIEAAMVGAPLGEEIVFDVVYPEDYEYKELAGKPCTVKGTVKRVDKVAIPEYSDENVNKYLGYESVAQYEEQCTDEIVEALLYDHLLHSVTLDMNYTEKREQMQTFLEESYSKLAIATNMTNEEYANNVLLPLVKANNSSVYMRFLTGMIYTTGNDTVATEGEVKAYSVLEVKKITEGTGSEISAFDAYSFYMATVNSVQFSLFEKLVERYPELALTDDQFTAKATAYLQKTLDMSDDDIAEYLSGEGRNIVWVALMKDAAIEMMKANYTTVG